MKLNAPSQVAWLIAVIVGALGILATLVRIPSVTPYAFWLVAAGFIILALATVLRGR